MSKHSVRPGDFNDPQVKALLTYHLEQMHANSPPGLAYALDWSGLQKPHISFLTLWDGEALLGCGAIAELSASQGELKSMRTHPDHLRKGVARAILDALLALASARNYSRVSLETGCGPAFEPAIALYEAYGFLPGEAFSDYRPSDFNQFFHLDLVSNTDQAA